MSSKRICDVCKGQYPLNDATGAMGAIRIGGPPVWAGGWVARDPDETLDVCRVCVDLAAGGQNDVAARELGITVARALQAVGGGSSHE